MRKGKSVSSYFSFAQIQDVLEVFDLDGSRSVTAEDIPCILRVLKLDDSRVSVSKSRLSFQETIQLVQSLQVAVVRWCQSQVAKCAVEK